MEYPKLRQIEAFPVEYNGQQMICLMDAENLTDKKLFVNPETFFIISMFNGRNSLAEIKYQYTRKYGTLLLGDRLDKIIQQLDSDYFLDSDRFKEYREEIENEFKKSNIRRPAHSGTSYESDPVKLKAQIESYFTAPDGPGKPKPKKKKPHPKAIIVPHIDLRRGGTCYAHAYKQLAEASPADLYIILGISHSELKKFYTITAKDFETPFGIVKTDKTFINSLTKNYKDDLFQDEFIHKNEHSIEFQLIFLKYLLDEKKEFQIVPILCANFSLLIQNNVLPSTVVEIREFIEALKNLIASSKKKICLIAAADLAHIGPQFGDQGFLTEAHLKIIEQEDLKMLEHVEKSDSDGFFRTIQEQNDKRRICGLPAIYTLLSILEPSRVKLLKYNQSYEPTTRSVVTFASLALAQSQKSTNKKSKI